MRQTTDPFTSTRLQCLNFQVCLKIQLQKWVWQKYLNSVPSPSSLIFIVINFNKFFEEVRDPYAIVIFLVVQKMLFNQNSNLEIYDGQLLLTIIN